MSIKIKKISDVIGKRVYTDSGDFFGEIEEANLMENKVDSWRIRVAGGLGSFLGGAKGVIIPHQFVKSIGDICIINKANLPLQEDFEAEGESFEEEIEL
ncbi:MAG TPA: PRC-barrel domain-containing protein [Candidatus Paceibacterota bacterium]|nr:PRC-barrel domain-containing protein [Candidatus Paceibacterota bacterium]